MSFWCIEVYNRTDDYRGRVDDIQDYHQAMKVAKAYLDETGRALGYHCLVIKCGGVPLQCVIDNTVPHYVY